VEIPRPHHPRQPRQGPSGRPPLHQPSAQQGSPRQGASQQLLSLQSRPSEVQRLPHPTSAQRGQSMGGVPLQTSSQQRSPPRRSSQQVPRSQVVSTESSVGEAGSSSHSHRLLGSEISQILAQNVDPALLNLLSPDRPANPRPQQGQQLRTPRLESSSRPHIPTPEDDRSIGNEIIGILAPSAIRAPRQSVDVDRPTNPPPVRSPRPR
jgi:hypothetical protein